MTKRIKLGEFVRIVGGTDLASLAAVVSECGIARLTLTSSDPSLHIQLPEQYAPLKVDLAEVRWAQGRDFGLEFARLQLEEKARLQRFLSSLQRSQGDGFRQTG